MFVDQRKLFARRQLAAARVARKARQMKDEFAGASHPIGGSDTAAAFRALGAKVSVKEIQKSIRQNGHRNVALEMLYGMEDDADDLYGGLLWAMSGRTTLCFIVQCSKCVCGA